MYINWAILVAQIIKRESITNARDLGLNLSPGRPLQKGMTYSVFFPEEFLGQSNLADSGRCKSKELDMAEQLTH